MKETECPSQSSSYYEMMPFLLETSIQKSESQWSIIPKMWRETAVEPWHS